MISEGISDRDRFRGVILGTAVGDTLGLPAEGISRKRSKRLFQGAWRHRLVMGYGMISDDTEHTVFVGQSLLAHPNSPEAFARRLAWSFKGWLLFLPAGTGLATLRSILRLWMGFAPSRSGVFSAGNGPAMRSAIVGAFFSVFPDRLESFLRASTLITHTDPRALTGARVVAKLTAWCMREKLDKQPQLDDFLSVLQSSSQKDEEWARTVHSIRRAFCEGMSVQQFADELGLSRGITGYVYHSVPVAVYAWYKHFGDFDQAVSAILDCGGDTDTVGAMTGAMMGAVVGESGIPKAWLEGIMEWPRGRKMLTALADRLSEHSANQKPGSCVHYFWPALLPRNLVFLVIVLLHGLRRLAPPY